jgi:AcrR family transcriptional regulator
MASNTRDRILETALRLFNEQGLHEVGVRDIARELGMSPGNLAYHFPQKDVLVAALVQQLHNANTQAASARGPGKASLLTMYRALQGGMRNHLAYRFYQISYAEILRNSEELRKNEASLSERRQKRTQGMIDLLVEAGCLDGDRLKGRLGRLHEQLTIIMTSWLRAATVYMPEASDEEAVRHYAKLAMSLFELYCTPSAEQEMRDILAGVYDADLSEV